MLDTTSTIPRCPHDVYSPDGHGKPSYGCQRCNPQANSHRLIPQTSKVSVGSRTGGQVSAAQFMECSEGLRIGAGFAILQASER